MKLLSKTAFLLISITVLFASFSFGYKIKLNGESKIPIQTDCGRAVISGYGIGGLQCCLRIKVTDGQFDVHTDSLKLRITPERKIYDIDFILNNQEVEGHLNLKAKDKLVCRFIVEGISTTHPDYKSKRIEILPGNFLLCNNQPLIKDTLVMQR